MGRLPDNRGVNTIEKQLLRMKFRVDEKGAKT